MNHIVTNFEKSELSRERWEIEHKEELREIERLENEKSDIDELIKRLESIGQEPIDLYATIDDIDFKINFIKRAIS